MTKVTIDGRWRFWYCDGCGTLILMGDPADTSQKPDTCGPCFHKKHERKAAPAA